MIDPSRPREEPPEDAAAVVDPTHVLLGGISRLESRVPWTWVALGVLVALSLPAWLRNGAEPVVPGNVAVSLAASFVFFLLARRVAGPAGALLSSALLCACAPWIGAGSVSLPLVAGEGVGLLGVWWALRLQGRHREVGIAGLTALRIGVTGILLGLAVRFAPALLATFVAVLLTWVSIGLRRSSGEATTLPVDRRQVVGISLAGALVLLLGFVVAMWAAERFAGGTPWPPLLAVGHFSPPSTQLWLETLRRLLSPGLATDVVLGAGCVSIAAVYVLERTGGRQWSAAGISPWLLLGLYVVAAELDPAARGTIDVPLSLPPLVVAGVGWCVLRGLRPGRVRRQEYTFALVWLASSVLLVPLVPIGHTPGAALAASVTLLPVLLLFAGRAARALWESEESLLARTAVSIFGWAPVAAFLLAPLGPEVGRWLPAVLVAAAALGLLAEIVTVRPDAPVAAPAPARRHHGPRRGHRRGRGGRGGRHRSSRRPPAPG
ncbi:MAG: hypothetical protein ACT4PE_07500 [Candidatus Eiseniibacteriota bacterium]